MDGDVLSLGSGSHLWNRSVAFLLGLSRSVSNGFGFRVALSPGLGRSLANWFRVGLSTISLIMLDAGLILDSLRNGSPWLGFVLLNRSDGWSAVIDRLVDCGLFLSRSLDWRGSGPNLWEWDWSQSGGLREIDFSNRLKFWNFKRHLSRL